jgi:hypothetical protein
LLALRLHTLLITPKYRQYSAIADLHTLHFTVAHALGFPVFTSRLLATDLNTETITVSLDYTHQVLHMKKIFKSHVKSSHADLLSSSVLLVPFRSVHMLLALHSVITASSGILLTYIAKGPTSTNSKCISRDPYSLFLCDVITHAQADGHTGNTSFDGHLLLLCGITAPVPASSTFACAYRIYRDFAWQRVYQICHNIVNEEFHHIQKLYCNSCTSP